MRTFVNEPTKTKDPQVAEEPTEQNLNKNT